MNHPPIGVPASPGSPILLPKDPVGGGFTITAGQFPVVGDHQQADGVSRKSTIFLTSPLQGEGAAASPFALCARISVSGPRGIVKFWSGFPAIIPVEGTRIQVEAAMCEFPYQFFGNNPPNNGGPALVLGGGFPGVTLPGLCIITDGWSGYPQPTFLAGLQVPYNGVSTPFYQPLARGPVLITDVTITNQSTSSVGIVFADANIPANRLSNAVSGVLVPAGATIGVGADALGCFWFGFMASAVTQLYSSPTFGGLDSNGQFCTVNVWGLYLEMT